ncbi:MAG: ABC transporter ATP-binding protein [Microbacteriaceae bacterium]|nr:ABC transporter ATP-binding protein [Microbacteriaceae bacterium]
MSSSVLTARNLSKHYGTGDARFDALRGIDLDIREGESVAIVGKSGSGKSTLMHILALLDSPSSGELEIVGQNAKALKGRALNTLRNATFGFVFQQFFLNSHATVLENVILPLKIARLGSRERKAKALETLALVELTEKASSKAMDLSGGQKQRVVIARALVGDPRIIFADEPTGNLDSATGAVIENLLFSLNRDRGITLVIVTHDDDLAARADRRIYLKDGRLVGEGDLKSQASPATTPNGATLA